MELLEFKEFIAKCVKQKKENDCCRFWMFPIYCAYFAMKHHKKIDVCIEWDLTNAYKALPDDYSKDLFKKRVLEWYNGKRDEEALHFNP